MNIEDFKNISGIYKFTNNINQKVYIGQAVNIYKRYINHLSRVKNPKYPLHYSIKKHGISNFTFEVIEIIIDINLLDNAETNWICFYRACDRYYGYNLKPEGKSMKGYKFSDESKRKMSLSQKERIKNNPELRLEYAKRARILLHTKEVKEKAVKGIRKYFETNSGNTAGKNLTNEHKNKISLSLIGRIMTKESIRKSVNTRIDNGTYKKLSREINQIAVASGKILKGYSTLTQASVESNIPRSTLHLTLNNKTKKNGQKYYAGGFDWEYK